jgi:hypothetical protein
MGGSKSKATVLQQNETLIVNKSSLDVLNEQIQKTIVNTTIDIVKECSASTTATQLQHIKGLKIGGDVNIGGTQKQEVLLDFTCAQSDQVQQGVSQEMVQEILQQMENKVDNSVMTDLEAKAKSKSKNDWGALPWGGSDAEADTKQIVNNTVINDTDRTLKNVVKTAVETNFTQNIAEKCMATVVASQKVIVEEIAAAGDFNYEMHQEQVVNLYADCVQGSEIANNITSNIATFYDMKIEDDTTTKAETEMTGKSESESVQTGFFQGIASVVESIGTAIGNIFGLGSLGALSPLSSPISVICCCCLCIMMIVMMFMGSGGGNKRVENEGHTGGYSYGKSQYGGYYIDSYSH